jgi:hypothetical protein
MRDTFSPSAMRGHVTCFDMDNPSKVYYERKNVICNGSSFLIGQLLASNTGEVAGVWGLAVGAGGAASDGWSSSQQPDPLATQTGMLSELKRKPLTQVQFLDTNGNPTSTITTTVRFLTVLNATTDAIVTPIREMGLIGGGTTNTVLGGPTNMLSAAYFDPNNPIANTVTLINYITCSAFLLPASINMGIAWDIEL